MLVIQASLVIFVLIMIGIFFVGPLWFKRRIIPKIEKRVGEKIVYHEEFRKIYLYKFGANEAELAFYITITWLGFKFLQKDKMQALNHVKYEIKDASAEEIIVSILYTISIWGGFAGMVILYFLPKS